MKKFKHVVSLGYFCSPAMEFERINRRKASLPFDWLIIPKLETVVSLIKSEFTDFLSEEYMFQMKQYPSYYKNTKWNIDFYHDFSPLATFESQITGVQEKYNRRISRFYEVIKTPVLFCRYITRDDLQFIAKNHDEIRAFLKTFNLENEIVYVSNSDFLSELSEYTNLPVYFVEKDINDTVSRKFLDKNMELRKFIADNVEESSPKAKSKRRFAYFSKVYKILRIKTGLYYRHNKQI